MNLKLIPTPEFIKSVKKLNKKYRRISKDLETLRTVLTENPEAGIKIGNNCYKIRIPNSSVQSGKSGGFRVIYYKVTDTNIFLLAIYSKSELENISDRRVIEIIKKNNLE
jgi:mRNA-degrading endonuclease RelE of RelBE toxin-antitoxin system